MPQQSTNGARHASRHPRTFIGQPVSGTTNHRDVIAQIASAVQTGVLRFGDRLPSERVLAEQIGVSRGTVRKATQALAQASVLEIRSGLGPNSGVYVASDVIPPDLTGGGETRPVEEIAGVLVARRLFEPRVAQLAGYMAVDDDFSELERIIDAQREVSADPALVRGLDASFHLAIARATHNPTLVALMHTLHQHLNLFRHPHVIADESQVTIDIHERTAQAIASRDPAVIDEVMDEHLRLLEGAWEAETGQRLLRQAPDFLQSH